MLRGSVKIAAALLFSLATLSGCGKPAPQSGQVQDEAKLAGRDAASFPHAADDYFHDMDNAPALTPSEIQGRNMWIVWTGGNDRFWDTMVGSTFGAFDLLKFVTTHPTQKYGRDARWSYFGVINEPCFDKSTGPDPKRFGLWLDTRRADCAPDPFEDEAKYPGVKIGARGTTVPVGSYYGYGTGIVGLRLFPNPAFDEKAANAWDAERYYTDPTYYNNKDLVRPYRVGMSCGFCHVGPSPIHAPADPTNPQWSELSSTVGAQYLWVDRLFTDNTTSKNFVYQLAHTYRPGTMDTSLVSSDNINNPRTMNAIYNLLPRLVQAAHEGKEKLGTDNLGNKQFADYQTNPPLPDLLTQSFAKPNTIFTPHILKDGSDSVGALGALNRVYLNIGLFSEEWLLHFNPVAGGTPISPIEISVAEKNSTYWQATENGTLGLALFLAKAGQPDHLSATPEAGKYLTATTKTLDEGKTVFAETCARCHSSKAPPPPEGADPGACAGPGYLDCWNKYWTWTKTPEFKSKMVEIVKQPDFLDGNYLSTEFRVPLTLLKTNMCSPLATNALAGNIWDNFSSESYKSLPSVGTVTYHDPFTGELRDYKMPAGGRGYIRPPSLASVWSTAPFLLNNSVGPFEQDPSVDARMRVFDASIRQLLWPETRQHDPLLRDPEGNPIGVIDRTSERSQIVIPPGFVPDLLHPLQSTLHRWLPWFFGSDDIIIGPIPAGVPVNLLSNLQPLAETDDLGAQADHAAKLVKLLLQVNSDLSSMPATAADEEMRKKFTNLAKPMLELSKCPDFEVNRGHYFGSMSAEGETPLTDEQKNALIDFLKTF